MMRITRGILLLGFAAGCATAAPREESGETYIPYASGDGIVEWEAVGDDTLYVHALTGGWYVVRTIGRCDRLRTAVSLGFQTSFEGELDRHSAILAQGQRCPIMSVKRADGPPPKNAGT